MGYFKYTEDILEAIETNKYYIEAQKELEEYKKEVEKQKKIEPYFIRYYICLKIYAELVYKVNLLNDLFDLKNKELKSFILKEKKHIKKNLTIINDNMKILKKELYKYNFVPSTFTGLTFADKGRIKENVRDLIINYGIQYLNDSTYQSPKDIFDDFKSLIYWSLSADKNFIISNIDIDVESFLSKAEFNLIECNVCHNMTPGECCYCFHCNKLCGE